MLTNCTCAVCKKPIYRVPCRQHDHNTCSIACRNKYFSRGLYPANNPVKARESDRARRQLYKQKALEKLGGKCTKCGYQRCSAALDFHHLDSTKKDHSIKDMLSWGWNRIEKELEKCTILCANCHREEHYHGPELRRGIS